MTYSLSSRYNQCANPCRLNAVILVLAVCTQNFGCSGSATSDPVRPDVAKDTLVSALNSWKEGKTAESLRKESTEIVVQDVDWTAGAKLNGYELMDDGEEIGANLSIEVRLDLVDQEGKSASKQVWYVVGTDPVLTVFRDLMHP